MDITAFEVSHSAPVNIDATARPMSITISSSVVVDIAAFKVSHAAVPDIDATTRRSRSGVVMDIAAFKVGHSSDTDIDATAISRRVRIHVGVNQRCRAIDLESPAIITSGVVMDIAAFKVRNS